MGEVCLLLLLLLLFLSNCVPEVKEFAPDIILAIGGGGLFLIIIILIIIIIFVELCAGSERICS